MPRATKKAPAKTAGASRSGSYVHEAQRGTEQIKLRLPPGYAARLRALAESDGYGVSEWVATWIEMAERGEQRPAKR
jgi:hypothetical protein